MLNYIFVKVMKCPESSELVVLYAAYSRVRELRARYHRLRKSASKSDVDVTSMLVSLKDEISKLEFFLASNNYPVV